MSVFSGILQPLFLQSFTVQELFYSSLQFLNYFTVFYSFVNPNGDMQLRMIPNSTFPVSGFCRASGKECANQQAGPTGQKQQAHKVPVGFLPGCWDTDMEKL